MASLRALSARLIEKEVIDSDELKQIIEENSPSPLIVPGTRPNANAPPPSCRTAPKATNKPRACPKRCQES